jgi:hypothetical protein
MAKGDSVSSVRAREVKVGDVVEHLGERITVESVERDGDGFRISGDGKTFLAAPNERMWRLGDSAARERG